MCPNMNDASHAKVERIATYNMEKKKIDPQDRKYIFVDTETAGLDARTDKLVEVSYAVERGPIKTLYFGVTEVPEFVDNLIKFTERGIAGKLSSQDELNEFREVSNGHTMVAANPAFDKTFLDANGLYNFAYRMLDIESYAAAKLGLSWMPGMEDIYKLLSVQGYDISKPDHSSAGDVAAMQRAYYILEQI